MSIELTLNSMSVGEKVQLLEQVWDSLCRHTGDVRSPAVACRCPERTAAPRSKRNDVHFAVG